MATPNYGYEKRQRELAKKKKKEDKLRAKTTDRRPDQAGYAQQPNDHGQEQGQDGSSGADPASLTSRSSSTQGPTGQ